MPHTNVPHPEERPKGARLEGRTDAHATIAGCVPTLDTQGRSVEQWITSLHAALAITPAEEAKWNGVAQAMRENPATVQKLAAGKIGQVPQGGLENLISSFETLYNSMPDPQKRVALRLFQSLGREGALSYCQCFGSNR